MFVKNDNIAISLNRLGAGKLFTKSLLLLSILFLFFFSANSFGQTYLFPLVLALFMTAEDPVEIIVLMRIIPLPSVQVVLQMQS